MKTIRLLLLVLAASLVIVPKSNALELSKKGKIAKTVDQMPEFPGGMEALINYMSHNIKYPVDAKEKGVTGTVYIKFIVDKTGHVINAKVKKGVSRSLNKEALRVVNAMPVWKPGQQDGKPASVSYTIPIKFALN
jgi:periplasmic protein TonB